MRALPSKAALDRHSEFARHQRGPLLRCSRSPPRPVRRTCHNRNVPPEVGAALRLKVGLDDPIAICYVRWLAAMLHADWGFSFVSRMDLDALIRRNGYC
jgi:ABC-type dipeptide/oligopeptide/nickel transport system permease component